nr:retrovirus-related Pol polyprotein from transposon TNT 1-94 [Tanacetum cinerariifolium]
QPKEPNLSASTTIVEVPKELPKVCLRNTLFSPKSAPTFAELFKINNLKAQAQAKDTVILKLKEKLHSLSGDVNERKVKREVEEIKTLNIELDHKSSGKSLGDNSSQRNYKQSQRQKAPKLRKNRTAHPDYIRHTQEEAATLREIVESERLLNLLNTSLDYACKYTRRIQELLIILQQTCPCLTDLGTKLVAVTPKNKTKKIRFTEQIPKSGKTTVTTPPSANVDFNTPVLSSTGVTLLSSASGSMSQDDTKKNRIRRTQRKAKKNKLEDYLRTVKPSLNKKSVVDTKATSSVTNSMIATTTIVPPREPILIVNNTDKTVVTLMYSRKTKYANKKVPVSNSMISKYLVANKMEPNNSWGSSSSNVPSPLPLVDCRLSKLSSGQFCDSDLEVAFRQHTCFIRNLDGVDLLTGSRGNNLYTLSLQDMMASSPICLLSKAYKTKSWLWHRRLSHLNFGAINYIARHGLVRGLPKLKFEKDYLSSACAMGKSTKKTHKPKSENTNQEKLYLLHMDLCGPMRVESVNEKKYIFVIVDDYSRFTWVKFLRSKDETPDFILKFLKMIQVRLKVPVRCIQTDNGTEFVNQTLRDYYEEVGISYETLVARSPHQNGVVERRNRTLIEAAHTMLIYAQASLFLWAEAMETACFTQNRSIIRLRHGKTPCELLHSKLPDLSFFHVFGALCYPTNDSENLGKLQPKADIRIFIGYAPTKKAF